jgi:hypothetical protein
MTSATTNAQTTRTIGPRFSWTKVWRSMARASRNVGDHDAMRLPASLPSERHRGATGSGVSFAAVAKRVRSSSRPGSRRGAPKRSVGAGPGRPSPSPSPSRPAPPEDLEPVSGPDELPRASASHLTEDELRRAEALQAEMAAQERAAMAEAIRRKTRVRSGESFGDDVNAPLRVRAAHEYAYVARDVRRIALTGGIMLAILAVLAILINVLGVISV